VLFLWSCIVVLMARATRVDFPGAWYHVLNRGTERRAIFRSTRCCEKVHRAAEQLTRTVRHRR
jgi:hypothetical protein